MRVQIRGKFTMIDGSERDVTPSGQKERALVSVLALSPGMRRSRKWVQSLLWGSRFPEQASTSLRGAIYKIRSHSDSLHDLLQADRSDVWLDGDVNLDWGEPGESDILEDISVAEPEFTRWLSSLRFKNDGVVGVGLGGEAKNGRAERIIIRTNDRPTDPGGDFLVRHLADLLATKLKDSGPVVVEIAEGGDASAQKADPDVVWSLETDTAVLNSEWIASIRAFRGSTRRFLWSGRLRLPFDVPAILYGTELPNFVETAICSISAFEKPDEGVFTNLLGAATRVFLADRDELDLADRIFRNLESDDPAGIARAWRSFIGLTQALEHNDWSEELLERTLAFAEDAERRTYGNALATALLAQVQMKIGGDSDRGRHLANCALQFGERDPFALHAVSQAYILGGDYLAGFKFAELGRNVSLGLPNSYCWDMQSCLAALGIGKRAVAYDLARKAHSKMPTYRPALRYLAALSLLDGRLDDGAMWSEHLRKLEPEFQTDLLASETYPVQTLRVLGLQDEMVSVWKS